MGFLLDKCSFSPLDEKVIAECRPFSCGNADLDEFFQHDAPLYSKQMLGKSYKLRKNIPRSKQMRRYPGVLIGRLGINMDFAHRGIGSELMEFIKSWFLDAGNKTGCRFLIVDAYNEEIPLGYYQKNGFAFLFSSESQEAENTGFDKDTKLRTRLMYFDLISLVGEQE